jgi:hypothetical protein
LNYQISRNGQIYGPYTLDDLKRYLASGNVLPNDLAKNDEMTDWVPVSQLLAQQGVAAVPPIPTAGPVAHHSTPATEGSAANPGYTSSSTNPGSYGTVNTGAPVAFGVSPTAYAAAAASPYPDAPNLHWALVMLFTILTCGMFIVIWNLIVSAWLRRVQPNANAFYLYIVHAVLLLLVFVTPGSSMHHALTPGVHFAHSGFFGGFLVFMTWLSKLIARFSEHNSLEEHFNGPEPLGLVLNPAMTFFFGGLYFQAQLTRINTMKAAARFGQAAPYPY